MNDNRPQVGPKSERVAVDSVFADGTLRLLRSKRLKDRKDTGLECDAWGREKIFEVDRTILEALLSKELDCRRIKEGDVFFVQDGTNFFNKKISRLKKISSKVQEKATGLSLLELAGVLPELLILPIGESRNLAREEIKDQFAKLIVTQRAVDDKARNRVLDDVEQALKTKRSMDDLPDRR